MVPEQSAPWNRPVIEVRAVGRAGWQHSRFWTIRDPLPDLVMGDGWPEWMEDPRKTWAHPQDPIVYSFLVSDENKAIAKEWVDEL